MQVIALQLGVSLKRPTGDNQLRKSDRNRRPSFNNRHARPSFSRGNIYSRQRSTHGIYSSNCTVL